MTTGLKMLALALAALALVPSGAHLLEMPNKMALDRDAYFIVQGIYRGWWMLGLASVGAILADIALALRLRTRDRKGMLMAAAAAGLVALGLGLFVLLVEPVNRETQSWTSIPANWGALRRQWEYSHATIAVVMFLAFLLTAGAASRRTRATTLAER